MDRIFSFLMRRVILKSAESTALTAGGMGVEWLPFLIKKEDSGS
jgi:hypothetical protein